MEYYTIKTGIIRYYLSEISLQHWISETLNNIAVPAIKWEIYIYIYIYIWGAFDKLPDIFLYGHFYWEYTQSPPAAMHLLYCSNNFWQCLSFWSSLSSLGTNFAQILRIFSSSQIIVCTVPTLTSNCAHIASIHTHDSPYPWNSLFGQSTLVY